MLKVLRNNKLLCCSVTTGSLKLGRVYLGHEHAGGLRFWKAGVLPFYSFFKLLSSPSNNEIYLNSNTFNYYYTLCVCLFFVYATWKCQQKAGQSVLHNARHNFLKMSALCPAVCSWAHVIVHILEFIFYLVDK